MKPFLFGSIAVSKVFFCQKLVQVTKIATLWSHSNEQVECQTFAMNGTDDETTKEVFEEFTEADLENELSQLFAHHANNSGFF